MADVMTPTYAQQHAHHRPHRPGRRPCRRRADHGAQGLRLYRPHLFQGLFRHRCARPDETRSRSATSRPPRTPGRCICSSSTTCCWWSTPRTCSRSRNWPTRRTTTRARVGATARRRQEQNWSAGLAVYDVSKPEAPRQIGFMPVKGGGLHRCWYVGGRWAYASALLDGFSDYILITIDMADPTKPVLAGKYWLPGMNVAAGEVPNWPSEVRPLRAAPPDRAWRHRLLLAGATRAWPWST